MNRVFESGASGGERLSQRRTAACVTLIDANSKHAPTGGASMKFACSVNFTTLGDQQAMTASCMPEYKYKRAREVPSSSLPLSSHTLALKTSAVRDERLRLDYRVRCRTSPSMSL